MKDLMIDIETMGKTHDAVICSIGACKFDIETGELGNHFYRAVDMDSCVNKGLKFDASTIEWWLKQSEKAREALTEDCISLEFALLKFGEFKLDSINIWCHATFDVVILGNAYRKIGWDIPWHYRSPKDIRTLIALAEMLGCKVEKTEPTIPHNAVSDAIAQAIYCSNLYKAIRSITLP